MPSKSIVIASDHAGYELKEFLKRELSEMGFEVIDLGTNSRDSVDYADFGNAAAKAIAKASECAPRLRPWRRAFSRELVSSS